MIPTIKPVSPLRQRMLDDMAMRKLKPQTQIGYIRAVRKLSQFLGRSPAQATPEDLRRFQMHLVATGTSSVTLNATITGLLSHPKKNLIEPPQEAPTRRKSHRPDSTTRRFNAHRPCTK